MNAIVPMHQPNTNVDAYRASTDAAAICKEIVVKTAKDIQGRKYVCVEGWQAIAIAHGCAASSRDVDRVDGGIRAVGEVRRMSDGALIAQAEGFVGEDEATWFGGETISYGKQKTLPKRADYAIRAMAQTRAISRACRSAFAHVVVMMDAGLATTPAEEVPDGGFDNEQTATIKPATVTKPAAQPVVITEAQRKEIMALAVPKGIDARAICERAGVASIKEMPADVFDAAKNWVVRQKPRAAAQEPAGNVSDVLEDEIPY
jgi:hypothetical protein